MNNRQKQYICRRTAGKSGQHVDIPVLGINIVSAVNTPPQCALSMSPLYKLKTGEEITVLCRDGSTDYELFTGLAMPSQESYDSSGGITKSLNIEHDLDFLDRFSMSNAIAEATTGGLQTVLLMYDLSKNSMAAALKKLDDEIYQSMTRDISKTAEEPIAVEFDIGKYIITYLPRLYITAIENRGSKVGGTMVIDQMTESIEKVRKIFNRIHMDRKDPATLKLTRISLIEVRLSVREAMVSAALQELSLWQTLINLLELFHLQLEPAVWNEVEPGADLPLAFIRPRRSYIPSQLIDRLKLLVRPGRYVGTDRILSFKSFPAAPDQYVSAVGLRYTRPNAQGYTTSESELLSVWAPQRDTSKSVLGRFRAIDAPDWVSAPLYTNIQDLLTQEGMTEEAIKKNTAFRHYLSLRWLASNWMRLSTEASTGVLHVVDTFENQIRVGTAIAVQLGGYGTKSAYVQRRSFTWNSTAGNTSLQFDLTNVVDSDDVAFRYVDGELYG